LQGLSHNVHQARAPKALAVVRVVKKVGVLATTVVRPQAAVVTLAVSRAPTPHALTSRLLTEVNVALLHVVISLSRPAVTSLLLRVVTSPLQIVAKNLLRLVVTNRLPHAVKNHTHHVVKNRMAIVATPHAVINLMPHVAKIPTQTRALSRVRLSPALTVAPQIAPLTQVSPLAQRATLRHVLQLLVAKRSHHAVMLRRARVHPVRVLHVPPQARVVASPSTAAAVKS
jgi:hypothetical protein